MVVLTGGEEQASQQSPNPPTTLQLFTAWDRRPDKLWRSRERERGGSAFSPLLCLSVCVGVCECVGVQTS